jgi:8-amino-7-oxononanoate synthase
MSLARESEPGRAKLLQLSAFLRSELRNNGFEPGKGQSQIIPVVLGSNAAAVRFAEYLQAEGFGVRPIRPPTVPLGSARLRLSLTANHSQEILANLVAAMVEARDEFSAAQTASACP